MAKLKMKKYPKKPKQNASVAVKENYVKRFHEVTKENNRRKALNKKGETLSKKIAGMRPGHKK